MAGEALKRHQATTCEHHHTGLWGMVQSCHFNEMASSTNLSLAHVWAHTKQVYFYGDMEADRRCLAMCVWDCAASARAAGTKPLHRRAAALAPLMYDMYQLERCAPLPS